MPKVATGINRLEGIGEAIARISLALSGMALVAMLTLITASTIKRWATGTGGIPGTEELSRYLLVAILFLGLTYAVWVGDFIRVDLAHGRLRGIPRRLVDVITVLLSAFATLVMLNYAFDLVFESYERKIQTVGVIEIPVYIPQSPVVLGLTLLFVELLLLAALNAAGRHVEGNQEVESAAL